MVVAAITSSNVVSRDSLSSHSPDSMGLDNLVDPGVADLTSFHSTVQSAIQQTVATAPIDGSTFSANMISSVAMNFVNDIQQSRKKMEAFSANLTHLSAQDAIQLQQVSDEFSINVQLLSKGISVVTKDIDALVHMQ